MVRKAFFATNNANMLEKESKICAFSCYSWQNCFVRISIPPKAEKSYNEPENPKSEIENLK
jgi:hypothetical protein